MKTKLLALNLILFLVVMNIFGSVANGENTYVAKEREELYGIWINPEHEEKAKPGNLIYKHNGIARSYKTITSTKEKWNWKYTITDKRRDENGDIWYMWEITEAKYGVLLDIEIKFYSGKISDSGKVFEYSFSPNDYPTDVSPDSLKFNYFI